MSDRDFEPGETDQRSFGRRVPRWLLDAYRDGLPAHHPPVREARPGWSTRLAARLLPAADRDRYLDEYRSDLHELSFLGAPRRTRIACAVRILLHAPLLRWELRKPQRERAR